MALSGSRLVITSMILATIYLHRRHSLETRCRLSFLLALCANVNNADAGRVGKWCSGVQRESGKSELSLAHF